MKALKRVVFLTLFLLALTAAVGCKDQSMSNFLNELNPEVEAFPAYVKFDTLYVANKQIAFDSLFPDKNGEFVVIIENEVWVVYSDNKLWKIVTVNLDNFNIEERYSGEFDTFLKHGTRSLEDELYADRYVYYNNGFIVLNDRKKVVEYSINKESYVEYKSAEYVHPNSDITAKIDREEVNDPQIAFSQKHTEQLFCFFDHIEDSEAVNAISKLQNKKTWDGTPCLKWVLSDVRKCGKDIYIVSEILDYWGNAYAVVFLYDFESNSCKYVFFTYLSEHVTGSTLYFVENI